ncbi:class I SAM-dependent methyltransferase [Allofranklinella schreckenbergeri]|uniref:Class I SAM-dependent methyltransferase n=1 Tax=Allofranklinella schreckenbergeri TaxID=1076744 RepID=A0A3M6PXA5_9BURK|nr:class I SAM-dependent methyltransferase [Allofranklinella schreckenbergeri]RMW95366.1 class I SAM-dependent methyltransferase [Allofranklinella schreckenbergeri]
MNDQQWLDKWNHNFQRPEYVYGTEPNAFFRQEIAKLRPGRLLLAAEGEGRNAVHAARQGWQVSAFDISATGRDKALKLAAAAGVAIDYQVGELPELAFEPASFDALALIYAHFPPHLKSAYHRHLVGLLRPGGTVIFEAFSKEHLAYRSRDSRIGGPADLDSLFSEEEIREDFQDFDVLALQTQEITLSEGLFHNGVGSVVRFVGRKPG